ncbi:DUF6531 domain-containing protein [Xanthomonas theicola]|uniref:DUF6531 domain-containing protein n=1 Tax=Xanthomonas theicola TaxID=56464 RepID=UPI00361BBE85
MDWSCRSTFMFLYQAPAHSAAGVSVERRRCALAASVMIAALACLVARESSARLIQSQAGDGGAAGVPTLPTVNAVHDGVAPGRLDGFMALWGVPTNMFPRPDRWDDFIEPSKGEPDPAGNDAADECPKSGNPVVLRTGTKVETDVDFTGGGEMPLTLQRTFNSLVMERFNIFDSWYSNLDRQLILHPDTNEARMRRPDGRYLKFAKGADGIYREGGSQQGAAAARRPGHVGLREP